MGSLVYGHPQNHTTGAFRPSLVPSVSVNAYDPDTQVFLTASGITDPPQQAAITTLVLDLKSTGIWPKMVAIYPFVGGSSSAHSVNLKSPGTYDITWAGTVTHSANGVQGNGTNGRGKTGLVPYTALTQHSCHISAYCRSSNVNSGIDMGAWDGNRTITTSIRYTGDIYYHNCNDSNFGNTTTVTNAQGFWVGSRTGSAITDLVAYKNGTAISSTGIVSNVGYDHPTVEFNLLALGLSGGTGGYFSDRQFAFMSVGSGLTSTEVSNLYTLVQAYQTTLGRQV